MLRKFARGLAPLAVLAMGAGLAGCSYVVGDWQKVEGVPLAELDQTGDAPTRITLSGPDKVVITEGDALSITLDGNAEAGAALRFDRDGDELTIARDSEVYDGRQEAIVRITMPAPSQLAIAGSGTIESVTMAREASIEIAGSGDIVVTTLEAETLDVEIAGSGSVTATGSSAKLGVEISGSGDVHLGKLMADDVSVEIAGSGNVDLASNGTVAAEIAGSGDIVVTGSATCSLSSAGAGTLSCRPPATATEGEAAAE